MLGVLLCGYCADWGCNAHVHKDYHKKYRIESIHNP